MRFDLDGNLLGYDPDGDATAVRWEGMAYDGKYLYAADLRGNANGGVIGDVYVFEATGGISLPPPVDQPPSDPNAVPEVGTTASALVFAGLSGFAWLRRRKQA